MPMCLTRDELAKRLSNVSRITGEFLLRSGARSTVYFDKYRFEADPELLREIACHLAEIIPPGTDRIIGLEMGGIPLATALGLETGIKIGFCRKKPKQYGTRLQIEGGIEDGETVTLIEDVITSGGAALDAIQSLRAMNIKIMGLLAVVDREAGADVKFSELDVDYFPLYKRNELDKYAED